MTCNQLIVLLDIHRGFNVKRHMGTLERDLVLLKVHGFITESSEDNFYYQVTDKGERFCNLLKEQGSLLIGSKKI